MSNSSQQPQDNRRPNNVSGVSRKRKRRSIRNIEKDSNKQSTKNGRQPERPHRGRNTATTISMWFIGIVALLFLFFLFTSLFSGTVVTITPRTQIHDVAGTYTAVSDATQGELQYETISFSDTASQVVPAEGREYREQRASGEIIIYNNYSEAQQRFVPNTRFESADGRIYRIQQAVTIPGRSGNTPGSVAVQVVADEPGSEYNLPEGSEFNIPGLEGSEQFDAMYAQANTPIGGGIAQEVPIVTDATASSTRQALNGQLRDRLNSVIYSEVPENFYILEDTLRYSSNSRFSESDGTSSNAVLTEEVTAEVAVIDASRLAHYLLGQINEEHDPSQNIRLVGIDESDLSLTGTTSIDLTNKSDLNISLLGQAGFVWQFDEEALKRELVDKPKSAINDVLPRFAGVESATVTMRPFWLRSFPGNTSDITIDLAIPNAIEELDGQADIAPTSPNPPTPTQATTSTSTNNTATGSTATE